MGIKGKIGIYEICCHNLSLVKQASQVGNRSKEVVNNMSSDHLKKYQFGSEQGQQDLAQCVAS